MGLGYFKPRVDVDVKPVTNVSVNPVLHLGIRLNNVLGSGTVPSLVAFVCILSMFLFLFLCIILYGIAYAEIGALLRVGAAALVALLFCCCMKYTARGTPAPQWAWNDAPPGGSVLLNDDKQKWKRYDSKTSALIEAAYQQGKPRVFIGTPQGAPGPYCIHFGTACNKDAGHGPQQRRADGEKAGWQQRAIRREPRSAV